MSLLRREHSGSLRAYLIVAVASLTALVSVLATSGGAATRRNTGAPAVQSNVVDSHLLTATQGWVLTANQLSFTTNNGTSWTNITPPGITAQQIVGVTFLSATLGWVVATQSTSAPPLSVYYTQNGGSTWQQSTSQLNGDVGLAGDQPVSIQFIDSQHGLIAAELDIGATTSTGLLFVTSDGGLTWAAASSRLPAFGRITFQSPTTGWVVGGVLGNLLFKTQDGASTWNQVTYPTPSSPVSGTNTYYAVDPPTFSTSSDGVLPVTGAFLDEPTPLSGDDSALQFDVTHDGGQTWTSAASYSLSSFALGPSATFPASIVDQNDWISAVGSGGTITATSGQGSSSNTYGTNGLPIGPTNGGGALTGLQFVSQQVGWGTVQGGYCNGQKTDCHSFTNLYSSGDGGATWTQLTPP